MKNGLLKGSLITLEGGEGAGKTTLLEGLAARLRSENYEVVTTREPGGSHLGETIRDWLLHQDPLLKIGDKAELLLFLAARAQHIEECILPALKEGKIVLCDRFNDSTVAYQGGARGLGIKYVRELCDLVCGPIVPQLTLFLDIAPEVGLVRSRAVDKKHAAAGQLDRIESQELAFHKHIRETFRLLAKREPLRICKLDASQPSEEVLKRAFVLIQELILLPKKKR